MGQSLDHALGRSRRCFAKAEVTFGTQLVPVATDAFKTLKAIKLNPKTDRKNRNDNRNTRDWLERITGMTRIPWDFETYLLPSGTAGTKPNVGPFLKALLGVETINGGVSAVYTENNVQAMGSLDIYQYFNANPGGLWMETAIGAWVEEMTLKVSGKQECTLAFMGAAQKYAHTGTSTSNGVVAQNATTVTVQAADAANFQVGSVFAAAGDAGTGYLVSAVNGAVLTFAPGAVTGWANNAAITPYTPSETTVGSPVSFTLGSMTVDAVGIPVIDFEMKVKNNHKVIDDEAFQTNPTDYIPMNREITGTFTLRGRKDEIINFGKRWSLASRALVVNIGTIAGKKLAVSLPQVEIEFQNANIPDVDEVVLPFPYLALGSAGEDSLSLTFT